MNIIMTEKELKEHSNKILKFVTEQDKGALLVGYSYWDYYKRKKSKTEQL